MPGCVLCHGETLDSFWQNRQRVYLQCPVCLLVQVPSIWHLSPEEEKAHYDLHVNSPEDEGYRRFLARTLEPVCAGLQPGACGLDFGCGPGPTLSLMFHERGFKCAEYDIYYAPDQSLLNQTYDFITATEVVEHLSAPGSILDRLWSLLHPGGTLAVMTKQVLDVGRFSRWHYKNDPTHICFFHRQTFEWLARRWGAGLHFHGDDVVLLTR